MKNNIPSAAQINRKTVVNRNLGLLFVIAALWSAHATANIYTFSTLPGQLSQSQPVDATVSFNITSGSMIVTLTNLEPNIISVGQDISALLFTINNGSTSLNLASSQVDLSASKIKIGKNSTVTSSGTLNNVVVKSQPSTQTHWTVDNTKTTHTQMFLNDLNGGGSPTQTIIGPVSANGDYADANESIAGNSAHNPFIQNTATFTIAAVGLLPTSTVSGVQAGFGTTPSSNCNPLIPMSDPPSPMHPVPEPNGMWLFSIGALALFAGLRHTKRYR